MPEIREHSKGVELDLSEIAIDDLAEVDFHGLEKAVLYLPLPSIGRTNMHVDICSDLIDASWAAERLAAVSGEAVVIHDRHDKNRTRLKLTLQQPRDIRVPLEDCVLLFQGSDEEGHDDRYKDIREAVAEYEERLETHVPFLPQIIDDYYANLVNGAYDQYRADSPDYYSTEVSRHPERQLGFHKTAYSHRLGAASYASPDSWLTPSSVDPNSFFEITDQKYRLDEFVPGRIFTVGGKSYIHSDEFVTFFPMNQYFKSRVCASLAMRDNEESWQNELFDWSDAAFTHSPFIASLSAHVPEELHKHRPKRESCHIHSSGTLVMVDDGQFRHFLYDTEPLNPVVIKKVHEELAGLATSLTPLIGLSASPTCDWRIISDEEFEQLCYDVIFSHPKFDSDTIRKLGKSRSRDGGRDIEVQELAMHPGARSRKWIFQCKLVTDGSSLSARKVQDIGDMLDSYGAEGFGVMTSAVIDATLYDKLDSVCGKRGISQLNFSRLELERALVRNPTIRNCYFGRAKMS